MKTLNHTRNAIRFAIVVFWLVVIGLAITAFTHSDNAFALSWATWLLYATITVVVLYAGIVYSHKLWNIK